MRCLKTLPAIAVSAVRSMCRSCWPRLWPDRPRPTTLAAALAALDEAEARLRAVRDAIGEVESLLEQVEAAELQEEAEAYRQQAIANARAAAKAERTALINRRGAARQPS